MGGEPTFVSIDDFEAGEWNTDAVGPTKRVLADELIRRLRERFAPGGLLHYGQGKWYPGETLPRWTFSLYWRADGKPIWQDAALVAKEGDKTEAKAEDAQRVLGAIAQNLGLGGDSIDAAYEDPGEWLLKEAKLPDNVDPANSELQDAEARARMAKVFDRGLTTPTSYVLPVQRWNAIAAQTRWVTEKWKTRRGKLFLQPGDSPAGYRLPLSSLKHIPPTSYPHVVPLDPLAPRGPLPEPDALLARQAAASRAGRHVQRRPNDPAGPHRAGNLRDRGRGSHRDHHRSPRWPPQHLPAAGRDAGGLARADRRRRGRGEIVRAPGVVEGYAPPPDPRLNVIRVAPDPGVIEVNIHPASSWDDCVATTTAIYEEARQSRLGADKFMIDGRHTGTGGGNHVVVGGVTPGRQPLPPPPRSPQVAGAPLAASSLDELPVLGPLHRPDLAGAALRRGPPRLRSTSSRSRWRRSPRRPPNRPGPWLVDRLFRNLLVDVTGNTHRTRNLHRQALLARRPDRPAGPRRVPRFRDAAQRPDEPCAAAPRPRAHRPLLADAARRQVRALGDAPPRPLHAAALRLGRLHRSPRRLGNIWVRLRPRLVRRAARVPLPVLRRSHLRRHDPDPQPGPRTLARDGRARGHRRHRPLR